MRYSALSRLAALPFFTTDDAAGILEIKKDSARVFCSRWSKKGVLHRLKRDMYVSAASWEHFTAADFFRIANYLQVPSYLSFLTALSYHGVTTQVPRQWCESVSTKRSIQFAVGGREFHYHKFSTSFYFGFEKEGDFFIAQKEKALIDACHLTALGRYAFDESALDAERLDPKRIRELAAPFPLRTQNLVQRICRI